MCHHSNPVRLPRVRVMNIINYKNGLAENVYCCGKNLAIKGLITRLANVFFQLSRL